MKKIFTLSLILFGFWLVGVFYDFSDDKEVVVKDSSTDINIEAKKELNTVNKKKIHSDAKRLPASINNKRKITSKSVKISKEKFKEDMKKYFLTSRVGLVIEGKQYILSKELRAIPKNNYHGEKIIEKMAGYYIVKYQSGDDILTSNDHIKVVYNKSTKRIGLLTGRVILKANEAYTGDNLENNFGLTTINKIDHLNLTVAKVDNGTSLAGLEQKLKKSGVYENVELEIIEGEVHAN